MGRNRKGAVAIIEIMIIFAIGLVLLTSMTFSYRQMSNNILEDAKDRQFDVVANYIDSCFSVMIEQNKNMNYAPTVQKLEIKLIDVPETSYSIKGNDDNQVIITNQIGVTKILKYPQNNKIRGFATSQNDKITLTTYTNDTKYNIIEISGLD